MTNPTINQFGEKVWHNSKGQIHREDGPAYICSDGSKNWFINGQLHREDGPAQEFPNGYKAWWINGKNIE